MSESQYPTLHLQLCLLKVCLLKVCLLKVCLLKEQQVLQLQVSVQASGWSGASGPNTHVQFSDHSAWAVPAFALGNLRHPEQVLELCESGAQQSQKLTSLGTLSCAHVDIQAMYARHCVAFGIPSLVAWFTRLHQSAFARTAFAHAWPDTRHDLAELPHIDMAALPFAILVRTRQQMF